MMLCCRLVQNGRTGIMQRRCGESAKRPLLFSLFNALPDSLSQCVIRAATT